MNSENETTPSTTDSVTKAQHGLQLVREWATVLIVALVIAVTVRSLVLQQFYISGPSMESTMFQDNRVLVNKLSYRLHDIYRGDVVVFDRVTVDGELVQHDDLIKRVIALGGEKISIKDCEVFIDGKPLDEPYLNDYDLAQPLLEDRCRVPVMEEMLIPIDHLFVMGDNRPQSFDSRMFGSIEQSLVVGRAFTIIWPLSAARFL
ncbi:MAG: signal peptidase I [Actinobacteria bacterium]|nr:MAG: signal peptidase I [Actinomycetota bacterium]